MAIIPYVVDGKFKALRILKKPAQECPNEDWYTSVQIWAMWSLAMITWTSLLTFG